jgi:hypothetical protein
MQWLPMAQVMGQDLYKMWELLRGATVFHLRARSTTTTGRPRFSQQELQRVNRLLWRYARMVEEVHTTSRAMTCTACGRGMSPERHPAQLRL